MDRDVNFRDQMITASLKRATWNPFSFHSGHFRDQMITASLKLWIVTQTKQLSRISVIK